MPSQLRIGLTGGIGSGKSTVARLLVEQGAVLVDTDAISRALTAPGGAALPALLAEFGDELFDSGGALQRERLRELVFSSPDDKLRLESVLHPMIGEQALRLAQAAGDEPVVFDVPLLAESSPWRLRCHRILVVDCGETTQVERVMQRSGWTAQQVRSVIAQQVPRPARRAIADAVIFNQGLELPELARHASTLLQLWWR
jgi:dephospho-CoA kinase